jgi:hypothetical protein
MEDVDMADDTSAHPTPENGNGIPGDAPSEAAPPIRKRPKLDLSGFTDTTGSPRKGAGERRKGKSIFGVALGTLNKAKIEEKQRMSSEAVSVFLLHLGALEPQYSRCAMFRQRNGRKSMPDCKQNLHESKTLYGNKMSLEGIELQPYASKKICPSRTAL